MKLGSLIIGFAAGFVLSDVITSKYPQVQKFKVPPGAIPMLSQASLQQPSAVTGTIPVTGGPEFLGFGQAAPVWMGRYIARHGVPSSFIQTSQGRKMLKRWKIL